MSPVTTFIRCVVIAIFIGQVVVIRLLWDMRSYARSAHDKATKAERDAAIAKEDADAAINVAETQLRVGTGLRNPLRPE